MTIPPGHDVGGIAIGPIGPSSRAPVDAGVLEARASAAYRSRPLSPAGAVSALDVVTDGATRLVARAP